MPTWITDAGIRWTRTDYWKERRILEVRDIYVRIEEVVDAVGPSFQPTQS